jgi:hypothetical protein
MVIEPRPRREPALGEGGKSNFHVVEQNFVYYLLSCFYFLSRQMREREEATRQLQLPA